MTPLDVLSGVLLVAALALLVGSASLGIYVGVRYDDRIHYQTGIETIGYAVLVFTASAVLQALYYWTAPEETWLLAVTYVLFALSATVFAYGTWTLASDLVRRPREDWPPTEHANGRADDE